MRTPLAVGVAVVVAGRRFVLARLADGRGVEAWEPREAPGPVARCTTFGGVLSLVEDHVHGLGLDGHDG